MKCYHSRLKAMRTERSIAISSNDVSGRDQLDASISDGPLPDRYSSNSSMLELRRRKLSVVKRCLGPSLSLVVSRCRVACFFTANTQCRLCSPVDLLILYHINGLTPSLAYFTVVARRAIGRPAKLNLSGEAFQVSKSEVQPDLESAWYTEHSILLEYAGRSVDPLRMPASKTSPLAL